MLNKQKQNSFKSPYLIPILLTSNLSCTLTIYNASTLCQQIDNVRISCHCPSNSSYLSLHCFMMEQDTEHMFKYMLHKQSSISKVKFLQRLPCHCLQLYSQQAVPHTFQIFHSYAFIHAIHLLRLGFPIFPTLCLEKA